jgi:hypothetical protein
MNDLLAARKFNQLKFIGHPWITVEETFYRSSPHGSAPLTPMRRSTLDLPCVSPDEPQYSMFTNSRTFFTPSEHRQIDLSLGQGGGNMYRSGSRLQNLQRQHPEFRSTTFKLGDGLDIDEIMEEQQPLVRSDSIVSTESLSDHCFQSEFDLPDTSHQIPTNGIAVEHPPATSQTDTRPRVWNFCHEQAGQDKAATLARDFHAGVGRGRRKLTTAISRYSQLEVPQTEFGIRSRKKNVADLNRMMAGSLVHSFSAHQYRKYIDRTGKPMPDFLETLDLHGHAFRHKVEEPDEDP